MLGPWSQMSKLQQVWLREETTLENAPLDWICSKGLSKVVLYEKGRVELHFYETEDFFSTVWIQFFRWISCLWKIHCRKVKAILFYINCWWWIEFPLGGLPDPNSPIVLNKVIFFLWGWRVERYHLQPWKWRFWTQTWRSLVISIAVSGSLNRW